MNKFVKISLVSSAIVLGMSSISLASFVDVEPNNTYYEAIENLVKQEVINGYPDNTFRPDGKITRAEFVKMISIADNLSLNEENKKNFEDTTNSWASSYIDLASSNGLINGYEDNTFKPSNEITYGEVATILLRTLKMNDVTEDNSDWPNNCMERAMEIGLFNGVATNDILAINSARRDNVALMIWNKLEYEKNKNLKDTNSEQDNKNDEKDNNAIEIDTNKIYMGTVEMYIQRGGYNYIILKDFEDNEIEIKLDSNSEIPQLHTLLLYELSKKGDVRLKKKLSVSELDENYLLVEDVDDELIMLRDSNKILDLQGDKYELLGEEINLNKYDYYLAQMAENKDGIYEFDDVQNFEKEDLKLKVEDRIIFDSETKIAFIIRGIEQ